MSDQGIYEPIPQPPGYPVLGNLFDLRGAETPTQALMKLALGALLFILGSTLVALDVFRGTSRGSAAGKATPDDPTR